MHVRPYRRVLQPGVHAGEGWSHWRVILLAFSQVRERFFDEPAASLTDCHSCEFGLGWSTWRLRSEPEKRSRRSNQDSLDRTVFLDAREPHVQALELEAQAAVVDAQAVQNRGVEVVDVRGVLDDVVTEVVGLAIHDPFS